MRKPCFLIFLTGLLVGLHAVMPPDEVWVKTYDSGFEDHVSGIDVDDSGNVYVTGYYEYGSLSDCRTIKYDASGRVVWNEIYDMGGPEGATAVAVDHSGAVYITGFTHPYNEDWLTVKYDRDGNVVWEEIYDSEGRSQGNDIAVDGDYIYVAGWEIFARASGYVIIKYDNEGNQLWSRFDDPGTTDWCNAVAVDDTGFIYVTGESHPGTYGYDFYTIKYDSRGNTYWGKRYDSGNSDHAYDIAVDKERNVFVTGVVHNMTDDWLTIKYNNSGDIEWINVFDLGDFDWGWSVVTDDAGCAYVSGNVGESSTRDHRIIKYNGDGNIIWEKTFDSGEHDWECCIASDKNGYIYLTGNSYDSKDFVTIKYRQHLTISGRIEENDGVGVKDIEVQLSGDTSLTTLTDSQGYYEFIDLPCDGSYEVTPVSPYYNISPRKRSYSPLAYDRTGQDFTAVSLGVTEKRTGNPFWINIASPCLSTVVVNYSIPSACYVKLCIYDASGSLVEVLTDGVAESGTHQCIWERVTSGVYFVRLVSGVGSLVERVVVIE